MTLHQQSMTANVMDICWSRFDENLLAAGDCLWDMRQKASGIFLFTGNTREIE